MTLLETLFTIWFCGAAIMALSVLFMNQRERQRNGFLFLTLCVILWPFAVAMLIAKD